MNSYYLIAVLLFLGVNIVHRFITPVNDIIAIAVDLVALAILVIGMLKSRNGR